MSLRFDHVAQAVPDLSLACEAFADETGVRPSPGGPHPNLGTRNALVTLAASEREGGRGTEVGPPPPYLELIGPDPDQATEANLGGHLAALPTPRLFTWAIASADLEAVAARLEASGVDVTPPLPTTRRQPTGALLRWTMLGVPGRGGAWPFFIDWQDTAHPSETAPRVGALERFAVRLPSEAKAAWPFGPIDGVEFEVGSPALHLVMQTPRGSVTWTSEAPTGFFGG